MADVASLAVGLYLNDANFKNKLAAAYRSAGEQSAKFNRQAQQDAKKTDEAYQRIVGTVSNLAGKMAGLAGAGSSLGDITTAPRQAGAGSQAAEVLKLAAGLNDSAAAWRGQSAAARTAAQVTLDVSNATQTATAASVQLDTANQRLSGSARKTSVATVLASSALGMLGGPVGVAIQAGSAILYFHEQNELARQSALALKDATVETTADLLKLSQAKIAIKIDGYNDQLQTLSEEKSKIEGKLSRLSDIRIEGLERRRKGVLGFFYSDPGELKKERNMLRGQLEDITAGIAVAQKNRANGVKAMNAKVGAGSSSPTETEKSGTIVGGVSGSLNGGNGRQQALDQYQQLRQEIELAHESSLGKIDRDEQSSQAKLVAAARAAGASQADVQRVMTLNAESYQRQRLALAEQYAPGQAAVRKEQEASRELKSLYDGRLLTEREYQTARQTQQQESARQRLKVETDAIATPQQNIAGDVDPSVRLSNQLVQQQAQYQAYYQQGYLDKQRYEQLMQAATQESSDAQYQQALSLYGSQSRISKMQLGLVDMTRERTSGMMFDLLTGTQNFKQNMLGLFSSITQSVVQQLIDMAMQALLTKTILSTFMSIGGSVMGGVASAGAGAAGSGAMGMPTGWQGYVPNAKGGVYSSPSLSAYSGQVVSNPTLFAFAKGAGLMGEAGPEAIMPLKRGADGSLGIRANGMMGNPSLINVDITINSDGASQVQATNGFESAGSDIANYVDQRFRLLLNKSLGQGGTLNRAIKGGR